MVGLLNLLGRKLTELVTLYWLYRLARPFKYDGILKSEWFGNDLNCLVQRKVASQRELAKYWFRYRNEIFRYRNGWLFSSLCNAIVCSDNINEKVQIGSLLRLGFWVSEFSF